MRETCRISRENPGPNLRRLCLHEAVRPARPVTVERRLAEGSRSAGRHVCDPDTLSPLAFRIEHAEETAQRQLDPVRAGIELVRELGKRLLDKVHVEQQRDLSASRRQE